MYLWSHRESESACTYGARERERKRERDETKINKEGERSEERK